MRLTLVAFKQPWQQLRPNSWCHYCRGLWWTLGLAAPLTLFLKKYINNSVLMDRSIVPQCLTFRFSKFNKLCYSTCGLVAIWFNLGFSSSSSSISYNTFGFWYTHCPKPPVKIHPKCPLLQLAHGLSGWTTGFYKIYQIIKCQTAGIFRLPYAGLVGTYIFYYGNCIE